MILTYYEQVDEPFSFSTSDTAAGYSAPTLTCTQLGTSGTCGVLTKSAVSYWLDFGSSWSATNPLSGSNASERWEAVTASGIASSPSSNTVAYFHQYMLSFAANPLDDGTTSPEAGTSQWVNSDSPVAINAHPNAGFGFASWTTTNPDGITFSNDTSASTTATVDGAGEVTAGFRSIAFPVTFVESGLPTGMSWSVTVAGQTASSNANSLTLVLAQGTYLWNVSTSLGSPASGVRYIALVPSGQVTVNGPMSQTLDFVTQYYLAVSVGSTAFGITLSPASGWYDAGTTLELNATAGPTTYLAFVSWTGTGSGSYTGPDPAGGLTMNGPITETANFATETGTLTFVESGLTPGVNWFVTVNGVNETTVGNSIAFYGIPVGTMVNWIVGSPTSAPQTGSVRVTTPETITVTIKFTTSPSTVTSTLTTTFSTTTTVHTSSTSTSTASWFAADAFYLLLLMLLLVLALWLARERSRRERTRSDSGQKTPGSKSTEAVGHISELGADNDRVSASSAR